MTLVTLNIEGLKSNVQYLKCLIDEKSPHMICLQETWLYAFENKIISEICPEYDFIAKSVDDEDPLPPHKLPRGYGGVAILWKKSLSESSPQIDGTCRTAVLKIGKMTIINTYLPCRGKYCLQEFQEEVDQLHELLTKFKNTSIILAGDLNIDMQQKDSRATYLKDLLRNHGLSEVNSILDPTFIHHNGTSKSKIDYILLDSTWKTDGASYGILDDFRNTSTHHALEIEIPYTCQEVKSTGATTPPHRAIWHKGDIEKYKDILKKLLDSDVTLNSAEVAADHLIQSLKLAEELAIPRRKVKFRKSPWNPDIARLIKQGRQATREWKLAGKPASPNILFQNRKTLKIQLRQAQRREAASGRIAKYEEILAAADGDQQLFYQLIRKQRSSMSPNTSELNMNDITYTEDLEKIWRLHFLNLATPQNQDFDEEYRVKTETDVLAIEKSSKFQQKPLVIPITTLEVAEAVTKMKKNKAKDEYNLTAEHLQFAQEESVSFLTPLVNKIMNDSSVPSKLKGGLLHPIHKKGKSKNLPTNYRGITITPIIGKIIDYIHFKHQEMAVHNTHDLQYGFTKGKACLGAALILSEAISESKDLNIPLYVAVLDVAKAFDVVNHQSLLRKLHTQGLQENWWLVKQDMLQDMHSKIIWQNVVSDDFKVLQGTRQGGLSSPSDYKSYQLDLLDILSDAHSGFSIGAIPVPCPTVADDTILMSDSIHALQAQLLLTGDYAVQERYKIQLAKTSVVPMNVAPPELFDTLCESQPWSLNSDQIPVQEDFTHIGIQRTNHHGAGSLDPTVHARLSTARKTIYALMGAGLHGLNGLPPLVSMHIYNIYVIPRLVYGLEVIKLSKLDISALEKQHRAFIRNILHLPQRTAIPALHIISAKPPIKSILDQKILSLFRTSLLAAGSLQDIILRQHAVKGSNSHSWVTSVEKTLKTYNLPTIMQIFKEAPTKLKWKEIVQNAVTKYQKDKITKEALAKSTLSALNPNFNPDRPHLAIRNLKSLRKSQRATVKLKLLVGTYTLQSVRLVYKQVTTALCLLCSQEDETVSHFILRCKTLMDKRLPYLNTIKNLIPCIYIHRQAVLGDEKLLTQLILDPTHPSITSILALPNGILEKLEDVTQLMIYILHHERSKVITCK
jgi:hypothetical protein